MNEREIKPKAITTWNRNPGFGPSRRIPLHRQRQGGSKVFDGRKHRIRRVSRANYQCPRITARPAHPRGQPGMPHPSPCPALGHRPPPPSIIRAQPNLRRRRGLSDNEEQHNQQKSTPGRLSPIGRRSGNGQCRHPGGWGPRKQFLGTAQKSSVSIRTASSTGPVARSWREQIIPPVVTSAMILGGVKSGVAQTRRTNLRVAPPTNKFRSRHERATGPR